MNFILSGIVFLVWLFSGIDAIFWGYVGFIIYNFATLGE
jgi:hypothetical protein